MLTGFIVSFAMALVTLLDIRRGVLFAEYPVRTFFLVFNPWHVPMLAMAIAGMFVCYRGMIRCDAHRAGPARHLKTVTIVILTLPEIPMALQLIQSGFTGPAAALLVVLPAISLPCMMLLGGSLQRFRVVALLSIGVMIVGIAAGALFL